MVSLQSISREEWHFEKCDGGVKPVKGKYDEANPLHIKVSKIIKINQI
jgi:hypothetical protein